MCLYPKISIVRERLRSQKYYIVHRFGIIYAPIVDCTQQKKNHGVAAPPWRGRAEAGSAQAWRGPVELLGVRVSGLAASIIGPR
jgi:hypothetical protein